MIPILLALWMATSSTAWTQSTKAPKAIVSTELPHLIAHIDNALQIVAQQNDAVRIEQLSATFQAYDASKESIEIKGDNGSFLIHPKAIGTVEIHIAIGDSIEVKTLQVKAMQAVGRLGNHGATSDTKIKAAEFKAQHGIIAQVECCGFDAKCKVEGFQTIRISRQNQAERATNKGARFGAETQKLIEKAVSGDLYVFRQIAYRCPAAKELQRLEDMIFEIE
ncbi:MAG: GldM family protein [Bacteroidota bacterium]